MLYKTVYSIKRMYLLSEVNNIRDLYCKQGLSLKDIAKKYNCSKPLLIRCMDQLNIKRRSWYEGLLLKRKKVNACKEPNWQGGRWFDNGSGAWYVYNKKHPRCKHNGCLPEYILIAEKRIGRFLEDDEVVHHLDGNRQNSDPNNLCVMTRKSHMRLHQVLGTIGMAIIKKGKFNLLEEIYNDGKYWDFIKIIYVQKVSFYR